MKKNNSCNISIYFNARVNDAKMTESIASLLGDTTVIKTSIVFQTAVSTTKEALAYILMIERMIEEMYGDIVSYTFKIIDPVFIDLQIFEEMKRLEKKFPPASFKTSKDGKLVEIAVAYH